MIIFTILRWALALAVRRSWSRRSSKWLMVTGGLFILRLLEGRSLRRARRGATKGAS